MSTDSVTPPIVSPNHSILIPERLQHRLQHVVYLLGHVIALVVVLRAGCGGGGGAVLGRGGALLQTGRQGALAPLVPPRGNPSRQERQACRTL